VLAYEADMLHAGRLEDTTVGDLVAQIYRRGATGTLVIEAHTRQHRVLFRRGYLKAIKLEGHFQPLGERLLASGEISRENHRRSVEAIASGSALQGEALVRLGAISAERLRIELEAQARERIAYLVGCSSGRWRFEDGSAGDPGLLLHPLNLVRGTPRRRGVGRPSAARGRFAATPGHTPRTEPGRYSLRGMGTTRRPAHAVLGVAPDASPDVVRREYRRLALELHPDRHPGLDEPARRQLEAKFSEATAAYDALMRRTRT
jgi:DnaJ-domain-containing protein 1